MRIEIMPLEIISTRFLEILHTQATLYTHSLASNHHAPTWQAVICQEDRKEKVQALQIG